MKQISKINLFLLTFTQLGVGLANGWMKNIFQDARVGEKFNKTFLNYKVDGDSFEGVNVGIICREDSFPTYLLPQTARLLTELKEQCRPKGWFKKLILCLVEPLSSLVNASNYVKTPNESGFFTLVNLKSTIKQKTINIT
jgi:hypothetical protein